MTVVHPNAVSGINSITVQSGNSLSIHKADGSLIRTITGSTGVTTFATVSVGSAYTDFAQGGGLNIGVGASISNGSGNVLTFGTGGDDRATIDAAGNLVHGGGSSRGAVGTAQLVQVEGLTAAAGFSAVRNSNDANGPYISLAKSRGTALGAVTVIQDDDDLGAGAEVSFTVTNTGDVVLNQNADPDVQRLFNNLATKTQQLAESPLNSFSPTSALNTVIGSIENSSNVNPNVVLELMDEAIITPNFNWNPYRKSTKKSTSGNNNQNTGPQND